MDEQHCIYCISYNLYDLKQKTFQTPIIFLLIVKSLTFDLSQVCFQDETTEAMELLQFMSFTRNLKVDAAWLDIMVHLVFQL